MAPDARPRSAPSFDTAPVVELRQYQLVPGRRDELIELFERELIEPQEAVGIRVAGVYRNTGDADAFVWMRGFAGMEERREALGAFYDGPVWQAHRTAANATMVDSDNVLLLQPTQPAHPPLPPARPRSEPGGNSDPDGRVVMRVYEHEDDESVGQWLAEDVHRILHTHLETPVATWRTLAEPNSFPRLPVREDVRVFVWSATFADAREADRACHRLDQAADWRGEVVPKLHEVVRRTQRLDLVPTARSQHPGRGR